MLTLLVIEDEDPLRVLTRVCLERAGYRVAAVATLAEAQGVLRAGGVAGALADTTLPDAGGLAVLDGLRRLDPELPVLLFAETPEHFKAAQARRDAATRVLSKPWSPPEMVATAMELLAASGRQQRRECAKAPPVAPVVVDLGTGSGMSAFEAAERHPGYFVVAADISLDACLRARARANHLGYRSILFVAGDAARLPLRAGCAEEVSLSYEPGRAREAVDAERARVLRARVRRTRGTPSYAGRRLRSE